MKLDTYLQILNINDFPDFLKKYLKVPSLLRLKKVGYFCGMDYASKNVYDFKEYVSRFDHSLNVALIIYRLTKDKKMTIAGLFHDIATPCFSHVIDYMNKDYLEQESTEEYTENILKSDSYFLNYLEEDDILLEDIVDFKKYSIVDNKRPKLCADRLDGVILPGLFWTKDLSLLDIQNIINDITIFNNEDKELEIGFKNLEIAKKVLEVSENIDVYCHSNYDNFMMDLLANITKKAIDIGLITYEDLFVLNEEEMFNILKNCQDEDLQRNLDTFFNVKKEEIPVISLPPIKKRKLNPLVNGKRLKSID